MSFIRHSCVVCFSGEMTIKRRGDLEMPVKHENKLQTMKMQY